CALTMATGTAMGGWRIIKTLGKHMVRLQPIHGFAAQTTAATVIATASHFGMPISTTHTITTSIMGVGATKRLTAVKWSVVGRIVFAWILTLPTSGGIAYGVFRLLNFCGLH
ncbi:MAG TPA: inorganic phosphate transporter, partial [Verrucomicrobiae bacterium]|nr:inorganic phosphate transporter [Verrucomicrobiae bacterium]